VDSYTYDPQANGGVVRVKVTARFLKVDPTTGAVTETKEISKEGSSAPKLAPRPEKELASEAFRNAVRQIVSEFLGLPAPPPPPPPPKAISPLPVLIGLLLLGALIGAGRGRAAPPAPPIAPGPANAPSRVAAFWQGQAILVTWQIPVQGTPLGYNVYRADAGPALPARQADNFQRLNTAPITRTDYLDTQAERGKLYLYAVTAVYPNNAESERAFANADITGQPAPVGIGVPLPPRNLQAQPGDSLVRLTWEDPNPSGIVRGYRIYRGTNAPPTDANLIADETTVRTTTFTDRGLSNGTTYFYVVRAVSTQNFLSVPSAVVPATPGNLPPQAPTLSGQFNPNAKTVTLTWTPSPDPDIAYYEVARIVKDISRSRALTTRVTRQTPIINLSPGVARRILQTNPRLRQTASEFDAHVIASNITATNFVENVAQFSPSGTAPTIYKELHYAVRAVDQSGQRSPWSNVVVITPNSPPPSLATLRPKVIPGNGQVTIDLLPLLTAANQDPQFGSEWQVDKKGVRIFRTTTKGGTSAAALPPINSPDPLPLENLQDGRYFRDTQVSNGTRYFYAVELVDKLGVAGGRSQETAATPFASASLLIAAQGNRTELSGNGQDRVQLTVSVIDTNNRPIAGFPLLFSLTGQGTLTVDSAYRDPEAPQDDKRAVTDENGQAIATYQAPSVAADTTVTIGAQPIGITGVAEVSLTLTIRAPRVASIEVRSQKTQLTADGLDVTDVTITVRDTLGQPVPNKTVTLAVTPPDPTNFGRFEDLSGNPIQQTTTGTDGTARVRYRAGKRTGSVTLQASVTEGATTISGQGVVTLVPGAPATIELVANPSSAPADGSSEVRVTATVKDAQGNAVPRVQVQFSATPTLTITPSVATTDDTGQATVTVTAPTRAGSYTLRAQVGTIAATTTLVFGAGSASILTMSASRTDLLVSLPPAFEGTDYTALSPFARADITVTVLDANNNPAPNVVVQFSATFGTIQASAMTNAAGIARATYVAPTVVPPGGQVTVSAQAGTASGSIQLNILPGPPAKVRITANPLLLPADGRSQSQVRAEVRDANDNLVTDGVLVVFSARNPNNLSQTTTEAGQFLQSQVPTINGVAIANFIAGTQPGKSAVLVAQAFSMVFEQSFGPVPAESKLVALNQQGLLPTVQLGGQVQLVASAVEISVSDRDDTTNPSDRRPLRLQSPTDNFLTLTIQLVDGRGQPSALSGQPVFLSSTDARLLLLDLATNNAELGSLQVLTDASGKAQVRAYASRKEGAVTVTAELRDALGRPFSSQSVLFRQRVGAPATVVIPPPQPNVLFVPGAGTPTSTTITASVFDAANNPVEDGVLVTFTADAGTLAPTQATTLNGSASTTLSSSPDSGQFSVKATARVPGQQQPAVGTTVVAFAVNVTSIQVQANPSSIVGDGTATAQVTATFTGTIPNNTRVRVLTDRGFIGQTGQKSALVPVVGNALVVTFLSEAVTADTTATVRVQAINPQGNLVEGTTQITMTRPH
jgi:fibronectin type 3 domain-containing protein